MIKATSNLNVVKSNASCCGSSIIGIIRVKNLVKKLEMSFQGTVYLGVVTLVPSVLLFSVAYIGFLPS